MATQNEALVFGASGIIGWAVVNQLLSGYPDSQSFSKVTAVVNRSFPESEYCWPNQGSRLQLVSGVNLFSGSSQDIVKSLQDQVDEVGNVTHVFYFVFKPLEDDTLEAQANSQMMDKVAQAMNEIAPRLQSFVYAGGTRGYGIYDPNGIFKAPLEESMADMLPEDYKKTVAYPLYRQVLNRASKGRKWTWTEVCPDAVIGFTPHGSGFSLALHWGQYLSLLAFIREKEPVDSSQQNNRELPFPGTIATWNSKFTPVSSQTLGRTAIYAALHPEECSKKVINVADRAEPISFADIWPAIAEWFGFKGVEPNKNSEDIRPGEFVAKHRHLFQEAGRPKAVTGGVGEGASQG